MCSYTDAFLQCSSNLLVNLPISILPPPCPSLSYPANAYEVYLLCNLPSYPASPPPPPPPKVCAYLPLPTSSFTALLKPPTPLFVAVEIEKIRWFNFDWIECVATVQLNTESQSCDKPNVEFFS